MNRIPAKSLFYTVLKDLVADGLDVDWSQHPAIKEILIAFVNTLSIERLKAVEFESIIRRSELKNASPETLARVWYQFYAKPLRENDLVELKDTAIDESFRVFFEPAVKTAKVVLCKIAQLKEFLGVKPPDAKFQLPFESIWLEFDQPYGPPGASEHNLARGVLVFKVDLVNGAKRNLVGILGLGTGGCCFASIGRFNSDGIWVPQDDELEYLEDVEVRLQDFGFQFCQSVLSFLYLLQADNVTLEAHEQPAKINAKRKREGKPPLPGWYSVVFIDAPRNEVSRHGAGVGPNVRFDVRGHWRVIHRGEPEQKITWVRPHQRGLVNEIYRPSVWALKDIHEVAR